MCSIQDSYNTVRKGPVKKSSMHLSSKEDFFSEVTLSSPFLVIS